jgi:hypothetical protein
MVSLSLKTTWATAAQLHENNTVQLVWSPDASTMCPIILYFQQSMLRFGLSQSEELSRHKRFSVTEMQHLLKCNGKTATNDASLVTYTIRWLPIKKQPRLSATTNKWQEKKYFYSQLLAVTFFSVSLAQQTDTKMSWIWMLKEWDHL